MFEIIFLLVGLVVGVVIGWLVSASRATKSGVQDPQVAELRPALERAQAQLASATVAQATADSAREELQRQVAYLKEQLTIQQEAEKERLKRQSEEALKREEEKRLKENAALKEQSDILSALAPVSENLATLQKKVSQIEESRKEEVGSVAEQLRSLGRHQEILTKTTDSLASALRNNKVRGAWGEAQLRNIIESAGLIEHVDFDVQVSVEGAQGKTSRPDMIVHLPGGKTIPVDAKAPYMEYQKASEIPDTASADELAQKRQHLADHAKAMRQHVKTLGERAYWNDFAITPDFVIAFIPNESLLQAALETDPSLMDYAFEQKVALTSPVTLWAVIKSVAYAWQQQSLTEDAKKLFDITSTLYSRFETLGNRATKLGRSITSTVQSYNAFMGTLETRVIPEARKLKRVNPKNLEDFSLIESDKADVRQIVAPELLQDETVEAEVLSENHDEPSTGDKPRGVESTASDSEES